MDLDLKYRVGKVRDRLARKVVSKLPRWVIYHAVIRAGVHATTGPYSQQVVPELGFFETLERWVKP